MSYVYFARPISMPGPIKIGSSQAPLSRLLQLAAWSPFPLEIAATVPGNAALEYNIHDCFFHSHSHLEWFHPTPPLLSLIAALRAGVPIEHAIDLNKREGSVKGKKIVSSPRRGPPKTKYLSYSKRIRHAIKRLEASLCERRFAPQWVDDLVETLYRNGTISADEEARLSAFIADPKESLTYDEWSKNIVVYKTIRVPLSEANKTESAQ